MPPDVAAASPLLVAASSTLTGRGASAAAGVEAKSATEASRCRRSNSACCSAGSRGGDGPGLNVDEARAVVRRVVGDGRVAGRVVVKGRTRRLRVRRVSVLVGDIVVCCFVCCLTSVLETLER